MVVNPSYKLGDGLSLPRSDFPKTDQYCRKFPDTKPPRPELCTLDLHPFAADMHDAARSASRGDALLRTVWDPTSLPPSYKRGPAQPVGSRRMLAVTDAATAARFDLPVARLRNASGAFVEPTAPNLLAGLAAMKPGSVTAVREPNPRTTGPNAYPLTTLTYATTVPASLDAAARKDYAGFLKYAAGAGQEPGLSPGMLSPGYAPLPADLRAQANTAADILLRYRPPPVTPRTTPSSSDVDDGSAGSGDGSSAGGPSGSGGGAQPGGDTPAGTPTNAARRPGGPVPVAAPPQRTTTIAQQRRTAALPLTGARFALVAVSILGGLAAGAGPALLRYAGRVRRR
jgi:hypothetical protein